MKKIILATVLMLSLNIFAQDVNPSLFVATTSIKKNICSDFKSVQEEVKNYQEYMEKSKQFKEENKLNAYASPNVSIVKPNQCVIVYEYKGKRSGFNCSPMLISFKIGPSFEKCEAQLKKSVEENKNAFLSQPTIIYRWSGKDAINIKN